MNGARGASYAEGRPLSTAPSCDDRLTLFLHSGGRWRHAHQVSIEKQNVDFVRRRVEILVPPLRWVEFFESVATLQRIPQALVSGGRSNPTSNHAKRIVAGGMTMRNTDSGGLQRITADTHDGKWTGIRSSLQTSPFPPSKLVSHADCPVNDKLMGGADIPACLKPTLINVD